MSLFKTVINIHVLCFHYHWLLRTQIPLVGIAILAILGFHTTICLISVPTFTSSSSKDSSIHPSQVRRRALPSISGWCSLESHSVMLQGIITFLIHYNMRQKTSFTNMEYLGIIFSYFCSIPPTCLFSFIFVEKWLWNHRHTKKDMCASANSIK